MAVHKMDWVKLLWWWDLYRRNQKGKDGVYYTVSVEKDWIWLHKKGALYCKGTLISRGIRLLVQTGN